MVERQVGGRGKAVRRHPPSRSGNGLGFTQYRQIGPLIVAIHLSIQDMMWGLRSREGPLIVAIHLRVQGMVWGSLRMLEYTR